MLGCCGNVASVPKPLFINYSRIFYFGYVCLKSNFILISHLTDKCAIFCYAILVYGHVAIVWPDQGPKVK